MGPRRALTAELRSLFDAVVEGVDLFDELGALLKRKTGVALLAPGRPGLVDLEIQLLGDFDERVFVRRVQPAAAEVEGDVGRRHDGVATAADAIARFQHDQR
jgi:hypothetical protein